MTPQQLAAIKTYIDATPELASQPLNSDGAFAIAAALNLPAVPDFIVWRTQVARDEITSNGFTWTLVDTLSVGTARIWDWMFDNATKSINPSKVNIRQGIADVWSGTAGKLAVQAAVLVHCKRSATVVEKLLATGVGDSATPATMGFEGAVSYQEVEQARAS